MPLTAAATLEREFLTIRAKILEIAASLDRLDRAEGVLDGDPRLAQIRAGVECLLVDKEGRAEAVQQAFSLAYEERWREQFGVGRKA
jgi:hypothetical protein